MVDINKDVVITNWLSPDDRYCIFLDELYDIKNQKKLGDIWESNLENFKFFIRYSTSVSDLKQDIKESINKSLNNNLIVESYDISLLKENVKTLISENWFTDAYDYVSGAASDAIDWVKSKVPDVLSWMGKGIIYLARKLRDAMYSTVGIVVDAILVATGAGKAIQWIPWAILVALDIYEITSGDYEEALWMKILFTLIDVVGLVTAGALAKGLRLGLKGATKMTEVTGIILKNPKFKNVFASMPNTLKKISPKLKKAVEYLSTRFPKGSSFIKKMLTKVDDFINMALKEFGKLFSKTAAVTGGITYGAIKGIETLIGDEDGEMGDENYTQQIIDDTGELDNETDCGDTTGLVLQ